VRPIADRVRSSRHRVVASRVRSRHQQSFVPQGRDPEIAKMRRTGREGLASREHQQVLTLDQLLPHLSRQLPKDAFGPIASHGHAESLADDDSDAGVRGPRGEGDQVEERSLEPAAVLFDPFDLGAAPQEEMTVSRRSRHPSGHPSNGQPRPTFGPPSGQDLSSVFRAHPLSEAVVPFSFQVRRLPERERHPMIPPAPFDPRKRVIIGALSQGVNRTCRRTSRRASAAFRLAIAPPMAG